MVKIKEKDKKYLLEKISFLYGKNKAPLIYNKLEKITKSYSKRIKKVPKNSFSEKDVALIAYGNNIKKTRENSLKTLYGFLNKNLKEIINIVHIIGLFLYSSDRGFSIIDYKKINPSLGNLKDLKNIGEKFSLMVDFVCNHISSKSKWFKEFKKGNKEYKDFFIAFDTKPCQKKLEKVFRPRTTPLLVYRKINNKGTWLWRTFCHDQMDLNYQNPKVFLKMIDVFLFYIAHNAKFIRLDAIAYIWKKIGTTCFLTKESHIFVQILKKITDILAPSVKLVAEINTEFKDNIQYLGRGNEAQIIYNFPLPVMVLHAFYEKNSKTILKWFDKIKLPSQNTTLFNLLDCHDGISVIGSRDILSQNEINKIEKVILKNKGKIGYRKYKNKILPYEFNITWWSALNETSKETEENKIKKYIASRAISFSIKGIPIIYFLGLFGVENCIKCFYKTKKPRDINRKNFSKRQIDYFLKNKERKEYKIFNKICYLLKIRKKEKAFHPKGEQKVLFLKKEVFSIIRIAPNKKEKILTLINLSNKKIFIKINKSSLQSKSQKFIDILSKEKIFSKNKFLEISLGAYQVRWLKY